MTPPDAPDTATATFRIAWEGRALEAEVSVPTAVVRPRVLLPVIQRFTNALVELGETVATERGQAISCKAGCGACCRQIVPITETEAHHIRDLVEALPEPRRTRVRERFAEARQKFAEAGLLESLENPARVADVLALGLAYFRLGVACPFLENESCSIHPDRPLSCREFLVTSPAENCSNPSPETVRRVPTPGLPMPSFAILDGLTEDGANIRWVPLILATEWADAHPEPPATETGPELFGKFMTTLTRKKLPTPADLTAPRPEAG